MGNTTSFSIYEAQNGWSVGTCTLEGPDDWQHKTYIAKTFEEALEIVRLVQAGEQIALAA